MATNIGTQLKTIRIQKNLSQADVAKQLNISRQTLSKWELDKSLPDLDSLKQLSIIYNLSIDYLLELQKEKIKLLPIYTEEHLTESLIAKICNNKEPLQEQIHFISNEICLPLLHSRSSADIIWFATQKLVILPGRYSLINHAVTNEKSKNYLDLFFGLNYKIGLLTKTQLSFFSIIDWLEEKTQTTFSLSTMDFIAVGKLYDQDIKLGNSYALGYKTKKGNYDIINLNKDEAERLKTILAILDPEKNYYIELENLCVMNFMNKYRKKDTMKNRNELIEVETKLVSISYFTHMATFDFRVIQFFC
ncbi:helix-turn-helix domain-containing protein [Enterococcus rivorum]|nr:helix-turn-helix transcriptional regulator [Enterococcus rivorum]